jgi:hypothetical protein
MLHNVDQALQEKFLQVGEEKTADYPHESIGDEGVFITEQRLFIVKQVKKYEETQGKPQDFRWIERRAGHGKTSLSRLF